MSKVTTFLWYDHQAEEAAKLYTSLVPNSRITDVTKYENADPSGATVTLVTFELDGQQFIGMNAGPEFKFNESVSIMVTCEDQTRSRPPVERPDGERRRGEHVWLAQGPLRPLLADRSEGIQPAHVVRQSGAVAACHSGNAPDAEDGRRQATGRVRWRRLARHSPEHFARGAEHVQTE